jgi:hypothetical protein
LPDPRPTNANKIITDQLDLSSNSKKRENPPVINRKTENITNEEEGEIPSPFGCETAASHREFRKIRTPMMGVDECAAPAFFDLKKSLSRIDQFRGFPIARTWHIQCSNNYK